MLIKCDGCGTIFKKTPSKIRMSTLNFHSRECKKRYLQEHPTKRIMNKIPHRKIREWAFIRMNPRIADEQLEIGIIKNQ